MGFIDILLILGKKCNFRCSYCYTRNKNNPFIDEVNVYKDNLERVFAHIDHYVNQQYTVKLSFYGGEPLVYGDVFRKIVDRYRETVNVQFALVTNGSLLENYIDVFDGIPKERILLCISYDYSLQNENRKEGSYEEIRNVIRNVLLKGFKVKTITTIDASTALRIGEVFDDFTKLYREHLGNLRGRVNIYEDSFKNQRELLSDDRLVRELERIEKSITEDKINFGVNSKMLNRKRLESNLSFLANTYAICPDGRITWDVRSFWFDRSLPYVSTGTVFDDPVDVFNKRQEILKEYGGKVDPECVKCSASFCKIPAFQWHWKDRPIFWCTPPQERHQYFCEVNRLFSRYLHYGK